MNYRSLPRYANSDLSEFLDLLFYGKSRKASTPAQNFGTMFHALVLEGQRPAGVSSRIERQLNEMREAVLRNKYACSLLEATQIEQIQLWDDTSTGLPCKAKTDITVTEQKLLADLKTTSCRNYAEFMASCEKYAYDRQAAFYLDGSSQATSFVILGVQKNKPYDVFHFDASAHPSFIEGGRKKYRVLLRHIQREGFVPSSWQYNDPDISEMQS